MCLCTFRFYFYCTLCPLPSDDDHDDDDDDDDEHVCGNMQCVVFLDSLCAVGFLSKPSDFCIYQ